MQTAPVLRGGCLNMCFSCCLCKGYIVISIGQILLCLSLVILQILHGRAYGIREFAISDNNGCVIRVPERIRKKNSYITMKICLAQTKPVKDIAANITKHVRLIEIAVAKGADIVVFPELSITGYEPTLAAELAMNIDDECLNVFENISNGNNIIICAGLPTKCAAGYCITMVIFQPGKERRAYSKKYLHADEEPFFVSGENFAVLPVNGINIGLAICYELSVPEHSANAFKNGADVYLASVAKTTSGVERAYATLAGIAQKHSAIVLMVNSVGPSDNFIGAGGAAIWNSKGELLAQLNSISEGVLIVDTATLDVASKIL